MNPLAAASLLMVVALGTAVANASDHADAPAGVSPSHWIPVSDRLGFVLEEHSPSATGAAQSEQILIAPPEKTSAKLMPPAKGYFVVKTALGWQRIAISEPSELVH